MTNVLLLTMSYFFIRSTDGSVEVAVSNTLVVGSMVVATVFSSSMVLLLIIWLLWRRRKPRMYLSIVLLLH